ncbi:hypothetical protein [Streptosporangium sp. NPDC049078]|uniref:hypothetical protein n=1 Tax=Streptosporangium sp. NPDC049078 TaxID=3155767 RepID=UPI003420EE98
MARLGRGYPARPYITRRRPPRHASVGLGVLESADEFPQLLVRTPNAYIALGVLESVDEFPALSLRYDSRVYLPALESADEFPQLVVNTPILPGAQLDGDPGQIEANGFVLGRGTRYRWKTLAGWRDRPDDTSTNVPEPSSHGTLPVRPLLTERTILWTALLRTPRAEVEDVVNALEQAFPVLEDETETPLVINDLGTPYLVYGRLKKFNLPVDQLLRLGRGNLVLQWVCSDLRRYNLRRTGVNLNINEITPLPNAGNVSTHPLIRIPGPAVNPSLLNTTLGRLISFALTVPEGQRLTIDPKRKAAYIGDTSVIGSRTRSSVPIGDWVLGRGPNDILYTATSGGSTPAVGLYRDAWA